MRRALIANMAGQGWTALANLGAVPLYIAALGRESYGLIGVYAIVVMVASLLDGGISASLNREMVARRSGARSVAETRDLLHTFDLLLGGIVLGAAALAMPLGLLLARVWLEGDALPEPVVARCLALMIVAATVRVAESVYRAALLGLGREVTMNALVIATTTLRIGGVFGAFALWGEGVTLFFWWQLGAGVVAALALRQAAVRAIGAAERRPRFDRARLLALRGFAGAAFGAAALGIVLTQTDKIVVARLVPLHDFAAYALAGTAAATLYQLVLPIYQTCFPQIALHHGQGDVAGMTATYRGGARIVAVLAAAPAAMFVFHARQVVAVWSGDAVLAEAVAVPLALLAAGTLAHGLYHIVYALQIGCGAAGISVRINGAVALALVPAIVAAALLAGPVGAAGAWAALMLVLLAWNVVATHRRLLPGVLAQWAWHDTAPPVLAAFAVAGATALLPDAGLGRWGTAALLAGEGLAVLAAAALVARPASRRGRAVEAAA